MAHSAMEGPRPVSARRASPRMGLRCLLPLLCQCVAANGAAAYLLVSGSPAFLPLKQTPLQAHVMPHSFAGPWKAPWGSRSSASCTDGMRKGPVDLPLLLRSPAVFAVHAEGNERLIEEQGNGGASWRIGGAEMEPEVAHAERPERDFSWGTRKQSYARVRLLAGTGRLSINKRDGGEYLQGNDFWLLNCRAPLIEVKAEQQYDIEAEAKGGGLGGQSGAIMLAVARELCRQQPHLRPVLKRAGFLTVDSRRVERKKFGFKKARKRPQYSKR